MKGVQRGLSVGSSRWIAIAAIMTALAIVGNYIVVFIPNVELGTVILFVTAFVFGPIMGIWSTIIMSIIFSSINPWGGLIPQIWIAQIIGWFFVVLTGSIAGQSNSSMSLDTFSAGELGFIGFMVTLIFDLITNVGYSVAFGIPYWLAIITGSVFMLVHVISNVILFASVVPRLQKIIRNQFYPVLATTENMNLDLEGEE
ncbi:MAG: hypothetical protein ACFFF4_13550 [Candidatus Thorarchaeota archaeon]